jgi:hypothetical protein
LEGAKGCDTLGVPLFDSEKIKEIWKAQSKNVCCIQDPPGLQLYTQVSTLTKGSEAQRLRYGKIARVVIFSR